MKSIVLLSLALVPLLNADQASITLGPPATQSVSLEFETPEIIPSSDGFEVILNGGFTQTVDQLTATFTETLALTQATNISIDTAVTTELWGDACSHGWCPGMALQTTDLAGVYSGPSDAYATAAAAGSGPDLIASSQGVTQFLLEPGDYVLFQNLSVTASDAGNASNVLLRANISLTDPPSEVPEPRWMAVAILVVLVGVGKYLHKSA